MGAMNAKQRRKRAHKKRKAERRWAKRVLKSKLTGPYAIGPLTKLLAHLILDDQKKRTKEERQKLSQEFNWWETSPIPRSLPHAAK